MESMIRRSILATVAMLLAPAALADEGITLQALFTNKAIVLIDGKRRVLAAGETSPEGVKLVSTDTEQENAVVEIGGKPQTLHLGVQIASFTSVAKGSVTLYPGRGGHYFADGLINGRSVHFMVDTGATTVAMGASTAADLGIDFRNSGKRSFGSTAGGIVRSYDVRLDKVQIGDIVQYNVAASVIEGAGPPDVLLGMSFLKSCDIKREGDKLELTQRY